MFWQKGGGEMGGPLEKLDGKEKMPGVKVERVERAEFLKRESQIRQLRYNVQSPSNDNIYEKKTPAERRQSLKPVREELRHDAEHEAIYLATDKNDKVIGFMYIELNPNGHKARLKEAWSSVPEASQVEMIEKFLDRAKEDLPDDRYPHLDVEDSELTKHFRNLAGNPSYSFVRIRNTPSSAANDNQPEEPKIVGERGGK
ncbi:MAG: hypothetical protein Q7R90_02095 [bacterium]|nr:hypothetical protein [bacterium]